MWTYATCFQPFKNYFKFNIIFDTFHKYLADRKEHKYINMLQTTKSTRYDNLQSKPFVNSKS
jgi:hypothetical protein